MSSLSYLACKAHEPYCHVAHLARPYFSTYLITGTIFGKKSLLNIKFVHLIFLQRLSGTTHSKTNPASYYHKCNVSLRLWDFTETWFFSNTQISNFVEICRVGAKLFMWEGGQASGGQTHMTKLTFLQFCVNVPKNSVPTSPRKQSIPVSRCLWG